MTSDQFRKLRKLKKKSKQVFRWDIVIHSVSGSTSDNRWQPSRIEVKATYGSYTASDFITNTTYRNRIEFELSEEYKNMRGITTAMIMEAMEVAGES